MDENNGENQQKVENGQILRNVNNSSPTKDTESSNENISVSNSIDSIEVHSIKDNLKLKMAQYVQNNSSKDEKVHPEPPLQKMKLDKKEEKDDDITGEGNQKNDEYILSLNKEEFSKEIELISELKKENYKQLYKKGIFCDILSEGKEWTIGLIQHISDDGNTITVNDIKNKTSRSIKIENTNNIAYFRKYTMISKDNLYDKRSDKKELKNLLNFIEDFVKNNNFEAESELNIYDLYYIIHSKIYLGLDSAMKINDDRENVGTEESLKIILNILLFISQYYKYILENIEDFINYEKNIDIFNKSELIDLKIINKKYAFFSFFEDSCSLLYKIFADYKDYLDWFVYFEKKLIKYIPCFYDEDTEPNVNSDNFPIYSEQQEEDSGKNKKNKLLLNKICLKNAYRLNVTYTSSNIKIKAFILAYFIDYFNAIKGFKYLFELCYSNKSINIKLLMKFLNLLLLPKSMTKSFENLYLNEKQKLLRFVYTFIDELNENTIINYNKEEIVILIQKTSKIVALNNEEEEKLTENMYFNYVLKNLLLSKKLEQKINSLNILNDIINNMDFNMYRNNNKDKNIKYKNSYSDIIIKKMTYEDFCINCKKSQILQILLNEKSVHEEILKRLPNIIFIMYKNNFGYINKSDEPKIRLDKKMVFDVIFNKLLELDQNNQKLSKNFQDVVCDFCEILSDMDKLYVFEEIKKYLTKGIEKRGVPFKEQLLFIIDFTLRAIKSKNLKEEKENKKNSENKKLNGKSLIDKNEESEEDEEEEEEEDDEDINCNSRSDDKLINLKLGDEDYYGLNILKNYMLDEEYNKYNLTNEQKIELITTAIEGITKIIQICKNKDLLLKDIFFKVLESINNSSNIIQFLSLFDNIRNSKSTNINQKFNLILDLYSRDYGFLTSLINDTIRYIGLVNSYKTENNVDSNDNQKEESNKKKVYEGLFNNNINIELRIKSIIFLLLQLDENEDDLINFKKLISSCETNELANNCLNNTLYENIKDFSRIYIILFYDIINDKQKPLKTNDSLCYKICKEIIKEINKIHNIFYFMNDSDLAVLNCETESKIKGIDILWNFLVKTNDNYIRNDITDFLADIFLGIKFNEKEKIESYWKNFKETIYNKLDSINEENSPEKEQVIQGIISLIKKIEKKSCNDRIIKNIKNISKEIIKRNNQLKKAKNGRKIANKKYTFQRYLNDNSDNKLMTINISISSGEFFYMLRYKLSYYFKIPINTVKIYIKYDLYDKELQEDLKNIEFDIFNDFYNTFSMFVNLEEKIKRKYKEKDIQLIFLVKSVQNEKLKNIKKIIKSIPQLTKLLKRKKKDYILDVWNIIKDENQNINSDIAENLKALLTKEDLDKFNSIFDFEDTNIYYTSYILSNLYLVINELNSKDEKFSNNIFLNSKIWEKIKNIKIENNKYTNLSEIYETNHVINYLLNIYQIISEKTKDKDILLFLLNKLIEYYYNIINESININFKTFSSMEGMDSNAIKELYIKNITLIQEIIIKNGNIFVLFIKSFIEESNNDIKHQFEFILNEGLLKNEIFELNIILKSFLTEKINQNPLIKEKKTENIIFDFYLFLLNNYLKKETYNKTINYLKEIALEKSNEISFNFEVYENNIKLYFDIIIDIIDRTNAFINKKINFNNYIESILLPNIFNPLIEGISLESSFHEIILGSHCKLLVYLLSKSNNYHELLNLEENKEKKLKQYLFEEIILNKCNKNIYNEKNLDNYKSISISSSYCFKQAVNLFIFLLIQNMKNNNEKEINSYLDKLTELHKQPEWKNDNISDWKLSFENVKKSPFVGIKNLGCTCYMNSLLQVFYNLIPFRESLLKCECKEEPKNSLFQIKKLFFSLKYLQMNSYNPESFPNNFDDEVLNVHQQMDVDEFYINILDKIENRLKGTKNENLVKYFFQGRQNDILTFQEGCTHHRTNTNNFYSIQLQVQNKKNIYESLDSLTAGELMDGDNCIFCAKCNKKLPVIKSQSFKSLPRVLSFVLKRFAFNYDTMKKVKINDYYEFPFELDMTKYKTDFDKNDSKNNSNSSNIYVLKSVVVHMGNSENGHYYSFIKNNNERWYEFNDSEVNPFNIKLLNNEAFGGEEIVEINGELKRRKKNKSAYLLFYEKKDQSDCEKFDNIEAINYFLGNINIRPNFERNNEIIENGGKCVIREEEKKEDENKSNSKILDGLNQEMFKYFLNKKLFSNEYQYFILELFLNLLNYYYNYELSVFLMHLCRNLNRTSEMFREFQGFGSNLNLYIDNKELFLFNLDKTKNQSISNKIYSSQILNLFKHFIIYFYQIFLRAKDKEFFGCMVDFIKFFINDQPNCANYLIEEFCNTNVLVEYLINCPLYDIKKIIVGILYCAMAKAVKENEYSKIMEKKENDKNSILDTTAQNSFEDDEELARRLQNEEENGINYIYDKNPLEYKNIPKNVLKMIYNILHLIRFTKYSQMNEHRFLYFTIYRFSLISTNTREFLIYKCRLFELLCLILHRNHQTNDYSVKEIIASTYIGPYTVNHNILDIGEKNEIRICSDRLGMYKNENYIYMLFFYLLSYTPHDKNAQRVYDPGYSLENKDFINVLLNNVRTRQDAFCFSNYIIEKSKDSKSKIYNVYDVLGDLLNKIDNNDKINYDYNNYNNFVNNNMNENPDDNDPGINPKYLLIIFKRFILSLLYKEDYVRKGIRLLFELFNINCKYYSYSTMIINLIIEFFSTDFKGFIKYFKKDLINMREWLEQWPIPPSKFEIPGINMYKNMKISYDNNLSNEKKNEIENIELNNTQKKIDIIYDFLNPEEGGKNDFKFEDDIDLFDFKFIIGDVILYQNKEKVIKEALDEQLKISLDSNDKKNTKNVQNSNDKREMWIEIDNPSIKIKELRVK